jgi:hypothetical protein
MNQDIRVTGLAAIVTLAILIAALGFATFEAAAPELAAVSAGETATPVLHRAEASAPSEASDPAACSSAGADPRDCTY